MIVCIFSILSYLTHGPEPPHLYIEPDNEVGGHDLLGGGGWNFLCAYCSSE